jgi:uncharacterized protein YndB with AHSA1/START domain
MNDMNETIERSIVIKAQRATVWRFFCDVERFASWWGPGSHIEARIGGAVRICYPGGSTASGEVLAIDPPNSIVFSFGYDDPSKPLRPGGSQVHVSLHEHPLGTRLELRHQLPTRELADQHVPGWRYQLAIFAKLAHAQQHGEREQVVDAWFSAWNASDRSAREQALMRAVGDDVEFVDGFAHLRGREELLEHLAAIAVHMPGVLLSRSGALRYAQATALVDWQAAREGTVLMAGTNVFELDADGRIARAVGISA